MAAASLIDPVSTCPEPSSPVFLLDAWRSTGWNPDVIVDPRIVIVVLTHDSSSDLVPPLRELQRHLPYTNFLVNQSISSTQLINSHHHDLIGDSYGTTSSGEPKIPWFVSFVFNSNDLSPGQFRIQANFSSYLTSRQDPFLITIYYHRLIDVFRGLGHILASTCSNDGSVDHLTDYYEMAQFDRAGLMLDCSRGSVPTQSTVFTMIRYISLLGINTLLLYTEDTYQVPNERFFGHLRGRYSQEELRHIDEYAAIFGIEVIPCIQTLGHLGQMLQWPAYSHLRDTSEVLLVHSKDTYNFLEKIITAATAPFRSKKVHIGMDECVGLGEGRYKHYFNNQRREQIFLDHLSTVSQICRNLGKEPLIWSDMLFCLANEDVSLQGYYESPSAIGLNSPVEPVFWSYYSTSSAHYSERIEVHARDLGQTPWVASGIWTWNRLWTALPFTIQTTKACLTAARLSPERPRNVITTIWGDDGSECDLWSTFPALIYFAHGCHSRPGETSIVDPTHNDVNKWFTGIFGGKLEDWFHASRLDNPSLRLAPESTNTQFPPNLSKWLLWEDPAYAHLSGQAPPAHVLNAIYSTIHSCLERATSSDTINKYPLNRHLRFPLAHAKVLKYKAGLRERLHHAYIESKFDELKQLSIEQLNYAIDATKDLWKLHRSIWMSRYKPFGWEILDLRYGGLRARLDTLQYRISEFLTNQNNDNLTSCLSTSDDSNSNNNVYMPDWMDTGSSSNDNNDDNDDNSCHDNKEMTLRLEEIESPTLVIWEGAGDHVLIDHARAFTPMRALGTG